LKKLVLVSLSIIIAATGLYLWDLKGDLNKTVKILKLTPLYEAWESISDGPSIGNVEPGEKLKVLRIRYAKDHMAVKVEKADGSSGWLIPDASVEMGQE
jgi:hypothetical protein